MIRLFEKYSKTLSPYKIGTKIRYNNKMKNKPSKKYKDSLYIGVPKENWIINEITNIA